jgi:hypothetical protein
MEVSQTDCVSPDGRSQPCDHKTSLSREVTRDSNIRETIVTTRSKAVQLSRAVGRRGHCEARQGSVVVLLIRSPNGQRTSDTDHRLQFHGVRVLLSISAAPRSSRSGNSFGPSVRHWRSEPQRRHGDQITFHHSDRKHGGLNLTSRLEIWSHGWPE